MALRSLPSMPEVILTAHPFAISTQTQAGELSDDRAAELEFMAMLSDVNKIKEHLSSTKKNKSEKMSKETAAQSFKRRAKDLQTKYQTRVLKKLGAIKVKLSSTKDDCLRTLSKLELLSKTIENKLKGHEDMKRLLEETMEKTIAEMTSQLQVNPQSPEMQAEFKTVKEKVMQKLSHLSELVNSIEKERLEGAKIQTMMHQVQMSIGLRR